MESGIIPEVATLLDRAAQAHHRYEQEQLGGVYDEAWPDWYARYLLDHGLRGYLGRGVSEDQLRGVLRRTAESQDSARVPLGWSEIAAREIASRFG